MVIDFVQRKDSVEVSYVNEINQIEVENIALKDGFYKYVIAEDFEHTNVDLRSFKGKKLKKEYAKKFENHNINEFLVRDLKKNYPEINKKIEKLFIPNPFSCDIETEINQQNGYSTPEKAENKVLTVSFTDINLNTILFVLKNDEKPSFDQSDKISIKNIITTTLGPEWGNKYDYNFEIRVFDSEFEMLTVLMECVNKYFHVIFGHNFITYDWLYILNRCKRLGVDITKASPTNKTYQKSFKLKKDQKIRIEMPNHRLIIDYMQLFKDSLIFNNLESYSLNFISELVLGLKKVIFEGNLKTLYENDYIRFVAYAIMDTILSMLCHLETKLYNIDFFEAHMNKIPYTKITQNSISEALIYNANLKNGHFLCESEFNISTKRKYQGGYVKPPVKKIVFACMGLDFSGLYPNSINTGGISPEKLVDFITVDEFGKPITEEGMNLWLTYKSMGYTLVPSGRVYDTVKDGIFVQVEKGLIADRKVFKSHVEDIYLNIIPKLEKLLEKKLIEESIQLT